MKVLWKTNYDCVVIVEIVNLSLVSSGGANYNGVK